MATPEGNNKKEKKEKIIKIENQTLEGTQQKNGLMYCSLQIPATDQPPCCFTAAVVCACRAVMPIECPYSQQGPEGQKIDL